MRESLEKVLEQSRAKKLYTSALKIQSVFRGYRVR
jgi:hypothetical protein